MRSLIQSYSVYNRVVMPGDPIAGKRAYSRPLLIPVARRPPRIAGGDQPGEVLQVTEGAWAANPRPNMTYQWNRNVTPVGTGPQYTIQLADVGLTITCVETATNSQGAGSSTSNGILILP